MEDLPITTQSTPPPKECPPSIIYRDINSLPLYLFIDCMVDDKIHSLVISGNPTPEELQDAWADILMEYNEVMADNEGKLFFSLHKQILQKEIELRMIDHALFVLKSEYIPRLVDTLNKLFSSGILLDPTDQDDYHNKLQIFRNLKASILMNRDMKRIQYEAIQAKRSQSSQRPDRRYFQTILLNLSDYVKYEVDENISVFTFCERFRRLNKFLETTTKSGK